MCIRDRSCTERKYSATRAKWSSPTGATARVSTFVLVIRYHNWYLKNKILLENGIIHYGGDVNCMESLSVQNILLSMVYGKW